MQRPDDQLAQLRQVAEAGLLLGRVDVEVHQGRIHLQEQEGHRVTAPGHVLAEGVFRGLQERPVRNAPAVDVQVQVFAVPAGQLRPAGHDEGPRPGGLALAHVQVLQLQAHGRGHPLPRLLGRQEQAQLAVDEQAEVYGGMREGFFQEGLPAAQALRSDAFHETLARRQVEEQLGHVHAVPGPGHRLQGQATPALDDQASAPRRRSGLRAGQGEPGAGRDAGQGLAAEAQGGHAAKVILVLDLGSGVPLGGQLQVLAAHALPVVHHPDALQAPALQVQLHAAGSGVQGVVQQLPYNGKRPVDHLAGRDLAGNLLPEDLNPPGGWMLRHAQPLMRVRMLKVGYTLPPTTLVVACSASSMSGEKE
jgi:hypothetical protein